MLDGKRAKWRRKTERAYSGFRMAASVVPPFFPRHLASAILSGTLTCQGSGLRKSGTLVLSIESRIAEPFIECFVLLMNNL
jgi:hypothetical protein